MSITKSIFVSILLAGVVASVVSCSDDDPTPVPIISTTFSNLNADSGTGRGAMGEIIGATGQFTFFSFKTGELVNHSDSASTNWDIGFRGTTIIVNSGTSGPGSTQIQLIDGIFADLKEAPIDSYKSDNDVAPIDPAPNFLLAIPTGSTNGWYTYDAGAFAIKPTPGKILIIRTSEGRYAKLELISYYKDAPATPDFMTDIDRYYTFRYVYQPNDGSTFE